METKDAVGKALVLLFLASGLFLIIEFVRLSFYSRENIGLAGLSDLETNLFYCAVFICPIASGAYLLISRRKRRESIRLLAFLFLVPSALYLLVVLTWLPH